MPPSPTRNLHRQPVPSAHHAVERLPVAHVQGPPQLRPLDAGDEATVHELLVSTQQQTATLRDALRELVDRLDQPGATPATITLTATAPQQQSDHGAFKALGVYNPNPVAVYIGRGGEPARPGVGALVVPANSAVVFPFAGSFVDVGADPAQLAQPAQVWLFRYATAQPFAGMGSDISDRPGRQLGVADVSDRAARVLGRAAIVDQGSGAALAIDGTGAVDVRDRGGRLLGVEQGGLADTLVAAGQTAAAPAAGVAVATIAAPGAGVYRVKLKTLASGGAPANPTNVQLQHGAVVVGRVLSLNGVVTDRVFDRVTVAAGEAITANVTAAEAVGVSQTAELEVTRLA